MEINKNLYTTSTHFKIGEGKYREVFLHNGKVIKFLKSESKGKFDIGDFNKLEYANYKNFIQKVPLKFRKYFVTIEWVGKLFEKSASISNLVVNEDGSIAKSIFDKGKIRDAYFWESLNHIETLLITNDIPLLDIRAENIIAQKIGDHFSPVFVDYKRLGASTYPFQPWLKIGHQRKKKIRRRFNRLREDYQSL